MITTILLLVAFADSEVATKVVNCPQIYGGNKLEKASDLVVDGTADFTGNGPMIRVRRTIKGANVKSIKISVRLAGDDTIWSCPDFWRPTKAIERGRFYLIRDSDTEFRITYAETR